MDKQTTSNSLSGVRTFAQDMAKKQSLSEPDINKKESATKPIPKPEIKEEPRIYQAPSWTGNKNKPVAKPEAEIKVIKPIAQKSEVKVAELEPEHTLKPLSAPKTEGETIIVESDNERPGVIITDAKRNRFRLFPAIFKSISAWFTDLKEKQVASKIPKYTVPPTSHRKGVIQRATSKTGKFASADSLSIHERIRLRKERAVPKTPITIWTANTEPGFPLLEAGENKISNIKVVLKKSFRNLTAPATVKETPPQLKASEIVVPEVDVNSVSNVSGTIKWATEQEISKPTPVIKSVAVATPVVATPMTTVKPTVKPIKELELVIEPEEEIEEVLEEKVTKPTPVIKSVAVGAPVVATPMPTVIPAVVPVKEPVLVIESEEEIEEVLEEKVTKLKPTNLKEWLFSININTISLGVFATVFALIIVSLSGYFWISSRLPDPTLTMKPNYQTLIESPLQLIYPNTLTRSGLFEDVINSFKNTEGDVAQQIFVASADGQTLLKPETVLRTLDFSLEPAFLKSISYIYFGGLRKSVPFILLDTADYTTARGGMLNWETTIYEDLSPLFNYNQLYDIGSIKTAVFTDGVIGKNDVRILRTLSGAELLVYGLINRDTVVITTNSTAFSEITNLLK